MEVVLQQVQASREVGLPLPRSLRGILPLEEILPLPSDFSVVEDLFDLILDLAVDKL